MKTAKKWIWSICRFLLIFGLSFVILYPLIQTISKTFMPTEQYSDLSIVWIPKSLTLENIKNSITYMDFWRSLGVTVVLCVSSSLLQLVSCSLTGYGFARFKFPLREPLFLIVILTIIIPSQIIFLPTFMEYRFFDFFGIGRLIALFTGENYVEYTFNLINTQSTFWIPSILGVGLRSGLFIYIFRQAFKNIPKALEEAAEIDGCGSFGIFTRVMLPNVKTSAVTVFLFSMVWHWNEYTLTRTLFPNREQPLAVKLKTAIETLQQSNDTRGDTSLQMGVSYASILLFLIPIVLLYLFAQKYFVEGIETTGITG